MSRVVSRVGLSRGRSTRPFPPAALLPALARYHDSPVYVALDAAGWMVCAGGEAADAAHVAVRARLAGDVHARTAVLTCAGPGEGAGELRVEASAGVPPHHELLLWPDEALAARAALPFLTPRHVRAGGGGYECHACGARFAQPNPLKAHLLLACAEPEPRRFWLELARRLAPPPPAPPALLEALCAEWGGRAHVCAYCGKAYSRKYGLKIHVRTHTGYRPLRCPLCARAFADPSNLNKHRRLHARVPDAARVPVEHVARTH